MNTCEVPVLYLLDFGTAEETKATDLFPAATTITAMNWVGMDFVLVRCFHYLLSCLEVLLTYQAFLGLPVHSTREFPAKTEGISHWRAG